MCKHSTVCHGVERWILSLEGSLVKTSPSPEKAQELTGKDQECGATLPESLAKYDPDSSSWKMSQLSLFGGSTEFSETWPKQGMTQNGFAYERLMWEPPIIGTVSGLLPTLKASDYKMSGTSKKKIQREAERLNLWGVIALEDGGGVLNPRYLEWFMGLKKGWINLDALATEWYRNKASRPGKGSKN